jgi:hypothetical protein
VTSYKLPIVSPKLPIFRELPDMECQLLQLEIGLSLGYEREGVWEGSSQHTPPTNWGGQNANTYHTAGLA